MKEQIDKEKMSHSFWRRNQRLVIIVLVFLLIVIATLIIFYPTRLKHISEQNTDEADDTNITAQEDAPVSNTATEVPTATKSASDYYTDGQNSMASQNWTQATSAFDQAIALDTQNPDYYNRKSQAQYNLGQKDQAIETLKKGIAANPDSDLLKSRLDVLQKDYFGSQPQ